MYYLGKDGQQTGPFSVDQLRGMAARGQLQAGDLIWKDGMASWQPASSVGGIFDSQPLVGGMGGYQAPAAQFGVMPPAGTQVPNHLAFSIFITLCCCIPFGVVAIIFSSQVNSKLAAGDLAGAMDSSNKAKMWCWIGFGLGVLINLIAIAVQVAANQ